MSYEVQEQGQAMIDLLKIGILRDEEGNCVDMGKGEVSDFDGAVTSSRFVFENKRTTPVQALSRMVEDIDTWTLAGRNRIKI